MSYCRFAWDGSDVYVYESIEGLTCCGCRLSDAGFVCTEPEEMIAHLAAHRRAGHFVPEHAITRLWADIPGAQRPPKPEPRSLTFSSLLMNLVMIEHEMLRQWERMSAEDRKWYHLPAGMTLRLRQHRATLNRFERERKARVAAQQGSNGRRRGTTARALRKPTTREKKRETHVGD